MNQVWDCITGSCLFTLGSTGDDRASVGHMQKINAMTVNSWQSCKLTYIAILVYLFLILILVIIVLMALLIFYNALENLWCEFLVSLLFLFLISKKKMAAVQFIMPKTTLTCMIIVKIIQSSLCNANVEYPILTNLWFSVPIRLLPSCTGPKLGRFSGGIRFRHQINKNWVKSGGLARFQPSRLNWAVQFGYIFFFLKVVWMRGEDLRIFISSFNLFS